MLKRIFALVLIAAAGAMIWLWLWLQRRHDDLSNMHYQFTPPDLTIQPAASALPDAAVVPAVPSGTIDRPTWPGHGRNPAAAPAQPTEASEAATEAQPATSAASPSSAPAIVEQVAAPAAEQTQETNGHAQVQDDELPGGLEGVIGYCVRCKTKRPIAEAHEETTESGRRAARGTCPVCGANMFTFLKDEA